MSKPNIDKFLNVVEEYSFDGEPVYTLDQAKEEYKKAYSYPPDFDEQYFNEQYSQRIASIPVNVPKEKLTDKPISDIPYEERQELYSKSVSPEEIYRTISWDPQDPFFQLSLKTPENMFGLDMFLDEKIARDTEGETDPIKIQRITNETYKRAFGGGMPVTDTNVLIPEYFGLTQKEFLNLSKAEKYRLANRYRDFNLTGWDKIRLGMSQNTKEHSFANFIGDDPQGQGKHPEQQQYIELARMLDNQPDTGFEFKIGWDPADILLQGLTAEAQEQFKELNRLAPQQFSPKSEVLFNRWTKKIAEITLDIEKLQAEELTPEIKKQLSENQMVLYGLVDNINDMIPNQDLKIGRDSVRKIDDVSGDPNTWSPTAMKRIMDAGGGISFSPSDKKDWLDNIGTLIASNFFEPVMASERPKTMLAEQLENKKGDIERDIRFLEERGNNEQEIQKLRKEQERLTGLINKVQDMPINFSTRSEFLTTMFNDYEEAVETIRKINLETIGDEDEYLNEIIQSMAILDSYTHDATGVDEASLDGDRIRLREMSGEDFLYDAQFKSRKFEALPKYMQAIFLQNITEFSPRYRQETGVERDDVTIERLKDMTVEQIRYNTDIQLNLDNNDLQRFVNYRDQVILSGPGQLMQFMMDIGSTPTFNPHNQTFTKETNWLGRALYTIAPFPSRLVFEIPVGALIAGATEGPLAALSVATPAESILDAYGMGVSDMPSYSSRVAAKIAIGDPGMMGDLPYIAHLYGFGERGENIAEYIGLALDFLIPSERILKKPIVRASQTFGKMDYPRVKPGEVTSPAFRDSVIEATVGLPDGKEYTTNVVLPIFAIGETLLTGTGIGMATELAYQTKQVLKGETPISPKIPRNYENLKIEEQRFIDQKINEQIEMGRRYNLAEIIAEEEKFNIEMLIKDGLDPENPRPYAEKMFPHETETQTQFINNTKKTIKRLKDTLDVYGVRYEEVFAKMKANATAEVPYLLASAHMLYEDNSTIPKEVTNTDSYKNVEKIIFGREDLSSSEKNAWINNLYTHALLLYPDNPKAYFETAYFDKKPITQVAEQSFDNVNTFYGKVADPNITANELMLSLSDEPISTRGVANFYAATEIDGVPALFEDTQTEIKKDTVANHYTRSLERSSSFETKEYDGTIATSRFLDTQYDKLRKQKTKLEQQNGVLTLLEQEEDLKGRTERSVDEEKELARVQKELDKGGRGRSIREKYAKASKELEALEELGSEQFLVDQRIRKRYERIEQSDRFVMTEEQKEIFAKVEDMATDVETLREAQFQKGRKSEQQRLLNETDVKRRDIDVKKRKEEIKQLRQELSTIEDFLQRQAIIEQIEKKQAFINKTLLRQGVGEKNVKTYNLGGKNEKARVRFVDEEDGVFRVETMRSVKSQKELLNLNKELYYRSEYTKAILEDASSNGYKTVTIPLGDYGIFHETMGNRVKTQDYYMLLQNREQIKELKKTRTKRLEGLNEVPEESKPALRQEIEDLNTRIERSIADDEQMYKDLKKTESHSQLKLVEDKFVEIIEDYVADIDENLKVERTDDGLVVHMTEAFRNVIGRTIEEEPTVYYEKGVQFVPPKEDVAPLPSRIINEEQIIAVKEARKQLEAKSKQLEEQIKSASSTPKHIKVENKNIKIELQRLKDFEETGFFESDGTIQFFRREDGKTVISIGDYNIVGREFLKNSKKGFLFESLVDKKTGEEVQATLNELTKRAADYEKYKGRALEFHDEIVELSSYLKYFDAYTNNRKLTLYKFTKEQYIEFRKKLGVTSEPLDQESYNLSHLLKGKKKVSGRKKKKTTTIDTSTIDNEFQSAFQNKANNLRDLFQEQGIDQTTFTRNKGGAKEERTIQNALKSFKKNILARFDEKHGSINTMLLRYMGSEFERKYTKQLQIEQNLKMDSLDVSQTTKLITEMMSRQYDMFGFDSASGHMLQNFADVFDQVGTASSPDLIRAGKKIVPVLNLGMGKDITKSFFGQELSASINTDVRVSIDYLGRNKLSKSEQIKLNMMRRLFDIDEGLPIAEQKAKLQEGNDMYQTYQPKRTDQTYHGLRKKSLQRLIDGIDEVYKKLGKEKQVDRALLKEKQRELELQIKKYERLQNEGVVFSFGGDKLHTDIMHFASDQTEGFGRMQGIMNELFDPASFQYQNMVMNMERVAKSYVENMILDSAQLGFDSIGFEKSLGNSRSVEILRDIAQRFGKGLEEATVYDRSGEIPVRYEFISFKIPDEIKNNVSNVTGTRFVRSIKTQDPVRLNGSHILQMVEDGEIIIRTPYGPLLLDAIPDSIQMGDKEGFLQAVSEVNKEINRVDFYNLFDSTEFEGVAPEIAQDYQQSMYAKGVAYEFQKALKDYVQFEIKGLDEIENVSIEKLKRASKPIQGEITITVQDAEAIGLPNEGVYQVSVEPISRQPLSFAELVALEQGIGLNDTLKMMQEGFIQADGNLGKLKDLLGLKLELSVIEEIIYGKRLPEGFVESSFGQHPQAAFTRLLPLLFEQYTQRFSLLNAKKIDAVYTRGIRTIDAEPVIARAEIEQGDVVSQIEIDGNRLRIKLSDTMTFNDFLVTNANILEMMMPQKGYKHLTSHYDSVGGRLTSQGVQQFASEMMYYIQNDVAPDLRTRAIYDHSIGYLSKWWDLVHRQDVPQGLNTQFNTMFNPHGKALSQAVAIGKKRSKYKVRLNLTDNKLEAMKGDPSGRVVGQLREMLSIPTQKVLLDQLNQTPAVRKLQRYAINDDGQPLYRFGQIKIGDEVDPAFLFSTLYGMVKADEYMSQPKLKRTKGLHRLSILDDIFSQENIVQLTPKHYVPESVREQVQMQVENQMRIILGEDYASKFTIEGTLEFENPTRRRHFISVVNSLGDVNNSLPQSLINFVVDPGERMHITMNEYNAFNNALLEREVPFGFSNRSFDVNKNMKSFAYYKQGLKYLLNQMDPQEKTRDFINMFITSVEKYLMKEDILVDLPPSMREPWQAFLGDLKKTTSDISRRMRELAANGEEGRRLRQRLEDVGAPETEIDEIVSNFLIRNNTHKRISAIQLIISENLLELERVDRHKLDLFFRLHDEIINDGFKDGGNIFEMFTFEKLDQIENAFTSKRFGISDAETHSLNFIREMAEDYAEQKRLNPNRDYVMSEENSIDLYTMLNEVQNGFINRYNYLDAIGDEVFRRFTGYTKADSGLAGYTTIINRKLLTLLFEGRFIHEPSIRIVRKYVKTEDIFSTNEKGQIYFKGSGEILTRKSANNFLYANGYGYINNDGFTLFSKIGDKIPSELTLTELSEVITEIIQTNEADSIQSFLASDRATLNRFLSIDPEMGRHDMLSVLGGLAILTHEKRATKRLANKLAQGTFLDLDSRLAQRREQFGNYFVDDMETFRGNVVKYIENMVAGQLVRPPSENPNAKPIMIVNGELPSPVSSILEIEAYNIAVDIMKDLELPVQTSRKNVAQVDINGQTYVLPRDFVQGLEKMKEDIVGSLSLGRYGDSEILDNMVLYEAERTKLTDLVDEDIKLKIQENASKSKETLISAIAKSLTRGALYTAPLQLLAFAVGDGLGLVGAGLFAGVTAVELLNFGVVRKYATDFVEKGFGKHFDVIQKQLIADNLFHQIITRTYHIFEGQDKEKLMKIKKKYEKSITDSEERLTEKYGSGIVKGLSYAASIGVGVFGNVYLGILLGLTTRAFDRALRDSPYLKGLTRKEANDQFISDVRGMYSRAQKPLLDEIGKMEIKPETARKIDRYMEEAKTLRYYVEQPSFKENFFKTDVNRILQIFADTFSVPRISTNIKMSVTALSGPQYWITNFFGMMNQEHLDLGNTPKVMTTAGSFLLTYATTGSVVLSFAGARAGRVVSEAMGRNFTFGKKNAQMYRGSSRMARPKQITMLLQDIQETSLSNRMGISEGMFIGLGLMEAGLTAGTSAIAGLAVGLAYKKGLDILLERQKKNNTRGKFVLFTRGGKVYTYTDILQHMKTYDVLTTYIREETGQILASELRLLYPDSKLTTWKRSFLRSAMEVAESYDLYGRIGMFLDELEMGSSPKEAAEKVRSLYFDYSDLSNFEKNYLRNVFLFYSFMRKNLGFMTRKLLENPERIMGWLRLTKGAQEMAFRDGDSELYVGDFWQGRLLLPKFDNIFNVNGVGVPFRHRSVQILPMTNVYDMLMLSSAIAHFPLISGRDASPFYRYILTSMGPVGQAAVIPLTEEIPFTESPTKYQRISPRLVHMSQRVLGYKLYGPKGSGAVIEYVATSMEDRLKGRTLATAERKKFKEPNPLDGREYNPATNEDGIKHFVFTQMILPATHASPLGMLALPFMPSGRPARSLEAMDRLDMLERIFGGACIDLALRTLGYSTNKDLLLQAQVEMQERGMDHQDPKKIGEYAKEMVKRALGIEWDRMGASNETKKTFMILADEYIRTDDTPIQGLSAQQAGLPSINNPSDPAMYFQQILQFQKNVVEK